MNTRAWLTDTHWPRLALFCAGLGLFWWAAFEIEPRTHQPSPEVELVHGERVYRVPETRLDWLADYARLHFAEGEERARRHLEDELDRRLDPLFDDMKERVPDFADWYYSLAGEYTRLALRLGDWAGLMESDTARDQVMSRLLPADFETELDLVRGQVNRSLAEQAVATREGWLAELSELLGSRRVPAPLEAVTERRQRIVLDDLVAELSGYEDSRFTGRLMAANLAAGGVMAAPLAARLVTRQATGTSGRALAARGASRGAARAGSGAATGAAVCAPGGALALGCALAAGTAAWLATDWLVLRADEALNRDEMETRLHAGLVELREELEAELIIAWERAIERQYAGMRQEITTTFRPLEAGAEGS